MFNKNKIYKKLGDILMINSFKNIIDNDNIIQILGFIVTIIVAYITAKLTLKNTKKSITTEYFKQKGVEIQENNLQFWCSILTISYEEAMIEYIEKRNKINQNDKIQIKINNIQGKKVINEEEQNKVIKNIQTESYIYSSKATIKAIRSYLQNNYKFNKSKKSNNLFQQVKSLVLSARIMSCMKNDFTGEKVDSLEILKMKITDWNFKRELIARFWLLFYYIKERYFLFLLFILFIVLIIVIF